MNRLHLVASHNQAEASVRDSLNVRMAAEANKLSKSRVHRVFQLFALQPHRSKSLQLSTDSPYPFFVEKVRAVVGLHLNPPEYKMVLSVDENTQIQTRNRT
jgi:putative transposase